jgi:hypothetical protein
MCSARSDLADSIATQLKAAGLDESYGVAVGQSHVKGKPYVISFAKARVLDGQVTLYGPKFLLVKWVTAFRDMPHTGQEKFDSVADAMAFINSSFVR